MYAEKNVPPPAYPEYQQQPRIYAAPAPTMYQPPMVYQQQQQNTAGIRDYLIWSILNLLFGWVIGGIIPLIFSLICRSNKNVNDYDGAKKMSTLALIFNILITVCGLLGWIGFIVGIVITATAVSSLTIYT